MPYLLKFNMRFLFPFSMGIIGPHLGFKCKVREWGKAEGGQVAAATGLAPGLGSKLWLFSHLCCASAPPCILPAASVSFATAYPSAWLQLWLQLQLQPYYGIRHRAWNHMARGMARAGAAITATMFAWLGWGQNDHVLCVPCWS